MYTSDIKPQRNRQSMKTALVYMAAAAFCILFDRIYALYGHGVSSASMTLMFLYPLLGGVLPFTILYMGAPHAGKVQGYRFFYNAYNSGVAALTIVSALTGVFEIAGTSSVYTDVMSAAGWALCALGGIGYGVNSLRHAWNQRT